MIAKIRLFCLLSLLTFVIIFYFIPSYSQITNPNDNTGIKIRVYDKLMNPREHPEDDRHHTHPPDWNTFGNQTRFTSLGGFSLRNDSIVNYVEDIKKWSQTYDLGDIFWPWYPMIYTKNFKDWVYEIKKGGQFIFDMRNYIPAFGPGTPGIEQFLAPKDVLQLLESELGDHWLGMDNGEQDGRYVGSYSRLMQYPSASRKEQYFNFQRHFQKMHEELGNRMCALVSLNFGHYFLKEGVYSLLGAETAQGLPNGQVYYSFIRGAGKQYGVPWFGCVSVFNRWGWKAYGPERTDGHYKSGPTRGTSLNLMKRLMYSHILYNSMLAGFEGSYTDGDSLSPIGYIQQSAKRWVGKNGQPGTMLTPVAVMLDFFSGWSFPRHLYSSNIYRVWGNLPYEAGDYLTDGALDILYPGYQNSSYFHDESGFNSPTPYGDAADCILSDAPGWLLERYPLIVVAGELAGGIEIKDKLRKYIETGGKLYITAGSLKNMPDGLAGIQVNGAPLHCKSGDIIKYEMKNISESHSFDVYPLTVPENAQVLAQCGNLPAVLRMAYGSGMITVFASPFGINAEPVVKGVIKSEIDKPLLPRYPLMNHVRVILEEAFQSQTLFKVDERLSLITCRKEHGEYTLGVFNNSLQELPLQITSRCGPIVSIQELKIDQSEKKAIGYLPFGFENSTVGTSDEWSISGGDTRLFSVKVREENIEQIPHAVPSPRPRNRALPLYGAKSIKEEILSRPTFFEHFDRVVIDWKYLRYREKDVLAQEAKWIQVQKLGVIVNAASGINLYPDIRLVNNMEREYLPSMAHIENVLEKMAVIGSHDLILSLHPATYIRISETQTNAWFDSSFRMIGKKAEKYNVTIHLRIGYGKPPRNIKEASEFIDRIGASNLKLAPCTGFLLAEKVNLQEMRTVIKDKISLWLVSAPAFDDDEVLLHANTPIFKYNNKSLLSDVISIAPEVPLLLDGLYKNYDDEYLDICTLERLMINIHKALRSKG